MTSMSGVIRVNATNTSGVLTAAKVIEKQLSLKTGTAAGQANAFYAKTLSVSPAASAGTNTDTIDLSATGNALFGGTTGFATVRSITLVNQSAVAAVSLQPSGGSSQWATLPTITLSPGAALSLYSPAGWSVGSSATVRVANQDTTTTVTGNTTNKSTSVTGITSTSGISVGQAVAGTGIASGTTVSAKTTTTLTLSAAATATGTGVSLTASWPAATIDASILGTLAT